MSLPLEFRDEARQEFDEAISYYARNSKALGREFLAAVQRALDAISLGAQRHPPVLGDIRKAVVRRFPYCVYFRAHKSSIEVVAVFHAKRNPSIWKNRN